MEPNLYPQDIFGCDFKDHSHIWTGVYCLKVNSSYFCAQSSSFNKNDNKANCKCPFCSKLEECRYLVIIDEMNDFRIEDLKGLKSNIFMTI